MKLLGSALVALILLPSAAALAQPAPDPTQPAPTPAPDPGTPAAPDGTPAPALDPAGAPAPAADVTATPAPETADAAEPAASVGYDKGFVLESGDDQFEMKAQLRGQVRYELLHKEAVDEYQSHFLIPRLRLQLEGFAYGKENTYKFEFDFQAKGATILKDYFIDHAFAPNFHLRAGQWKAPFSRHELVSDYGSWFNDRSIVNDFALAGRDIGVALHNDYEKSPEGIEWAAGLFNGTGKPDKPTQTLTCTDPMDTTTCTIGAPTNVPADWDPAFVARVGFNHGGIKGYSEADLEGGPLRFAAAASYRVNLNNFAKDADDSVILDHGLDLDFLLKVEGFDLQGAFYMLKSGAADAQFGYLGQAGYMVVPKKAGVAGRFGLRPDDAAAAAGLDESIIEALACFDWFFSGHGFKWMTDAGVLKATAGDGTTDLQVRTQIQASF